MLYLYSVGLSEEQIKDIMEINSDILNIGDEKIKELGYLLEFIDCNKRQIKDIIMANPFYLSRSIADVKKLISKLNSLGITNLNVVFDNNPYLLNRNDFEIDNYILEKLLLGLNYNDIISNIDSGFME